MIFKCAATPSDSSDGGLGAVIGGAFLGLSWATEGAEVQGHVGLLVGSFGAFAIGGARTGRAVGVATGPRDAGRPSSTMEKNGGVTNGRAFWGCPSRRIVIDTSRR